MGTSGVLGQFAANYSNRKVIDHALRRGGIKPEKAAGEHLDILLEMIGTITAEWVNAGYPLWTKQFQLFGPTIGSPDVTTTTGTVEVMHSYWRILQPYRGPATTSSAADASALFSGVPGSDIVIPANNPSVIVNFGTPFEVDTIGVLLGGATTLTAVQLQILTSVDGVTYTLAQTLPSATYVPGQWQYFDLDPTLLSQYVEIRYAANASLTLNQLNFGLANGQDILLGELNVDDYYNLPNKLYQSGQPNSGYVDRQLLVPILRAWPTPNQSAFYSGCFSLLTRRYIQDVGSLTNNSEVPPRWLEALQWKLAFLAMSELPDDDPPSIITVQERARRFDRVEKQAMKSEALMWGEERSGGPYRLTPNIGAYTR